MKITNTEVIKSGERDLIDSITADLNWGAIEDIFLKEHHLGIDEDIEYKKGDIIAYDNQVAYKLEFAVKVNLSILINRDGEYLAVNIAEKKDNQESEMMHEAAGEEETKETFKDDISQKDEVPVGGAQELPADSIEQKDEAEGIKDREDKYFEALHQLGSSAINENSGDVRA